MTKKHSTKRALIASILALCMCFTMLIGTTFAWFTDSVTSSGNVIQTGKLDVAMYWAEGNEDPAAVSEWNDASIGAIFDNDKWEPGYSEAKHIKIANEGTLALKYQMRIIANGVVSELANVIDVYYFDEAQQLSRDSFVEANKLGTLAEVLNVAYDKNISKTISGSLEEGTSKTVTLAFKMQESAGNEYQEMSIGADFSIQLLATQYTSEEDSFNNQYDADADFDSQDVPAAMVYALSQQTAENIVLVDQNKNELGKGLDVAYSFQPSETYDQALASEYSWAHADFYVYADATVPANSMMLAGYYSLFGDFLGISDTQWIALSNDGFDVEAGEENGIRLLNDGMSGISIAYNEICNYGNDGTGFLCGAADLTGANEGTTLTVELRLYKTYTPEEAEELGYGNTKNIETGEYITVGKFTYTFDDPAVEYLADGSRVRYGEAGEVILEGVDKAVVTDGIYYIPDGVTTLDGYVLAQNAEITTVVIPDTVTDFGATGVSATNASSGAFKDSAVETVVLPEGMTEIPAAAFNGATNLKNVNIPASVETIGVNAFRSTALETLTVPATVKTISYGAFRDMDSLTTVTIEGDVHIPDYAFRDCSALRTVYLNGENVTIGTSMAFANASSNNPGTNNITFYVKNDAVAAQVRTAMGVGTDFWVYIDVTPDTSWYDNAPAATEYTLTNASQLAGLAEIVNSGETFTATVKLGGNVDITDINWTPIGTSEHPFAGTFDGANNTINGLTIAGADEAALFGYIADGATIKDVKFENVNVSGTYVASVVFYADEATIENVHVLSGKVAAGLGYGAGIIMEADGATISNCSNAATITSDYSASGIGAWILNATVEQCVNNGDVTGANRAAGICANISGTVKNCTNNGDVLVTCTSTYKMPAGGISSVLSGATTFENCINNGDVTAKASDDPYNASAAGILGQTPSSEAVITNCTNSGKITAEGSEAAGIAISLYGGITATGCENKGDVYGKTGANGTVSETGMINATNAVTDCTNSGTVTEG